MGGDQKGDRLVQRALRTTLQKFGLDKAADLYQRARAYAYVAEHS